MTIDRNHKDMLFRTVFEDKHDLLSLYNALSGTDHRNPEDVSLNTLKDLLYLDRSNDISFILDPYLSLYEHQSTYNPNMPLRNLFYVTKLLQAIVKDADIYGSKLIKIPTPKFVVFYNGMDFRGEDFEIRLSEAFRSRENNPALELIVRVIDVNEGHNLDIMAKCPKLDEYARFIGLIRRYQKKENSLEKAIGAAIDEAIENGILADLLSRRRAEVSDWAILEYDEEKHIRSEKQISFDEGISQGRLEMLMNCVEEGYFGLDVASEKSGLSSQELADMMLTAGKKIPETAME